jgi:hypothetical protein
VGAWAFCCLTFTVVSKTLTFKQVRFLGGAKSFSWVMLRARWVTLRARWVTLRARWVSLRARWVTLRARWVTLRARWVTLRARWVTLRARWVTLRARWVTLRARWVALRARWVTLRARWVTLRARWVALRGCSLTFPGVRRVPQRRHLAHRHRLLLRAWFCQDRAGRPRCHALRQVPGPSPQRSTHTFRPQALRRRRRVACEVHGHRQRRTDSVSPTTVSPTVSPPPRRLLCLPRALTELAHAPQRCVDVRKSNLGAVESVLSRAHFSPGSSVVGNARRAATRTTWTCELGS